ncbi:LytR family transcriptional regulator [Oceanobacillus piezotolerans]|uniref:LytR family transcriptional regulator n=2 Tax=Oceanobacillus piezotolerans TaxID=2448030 RepID=A0A498DBY8_9BACI|nr:LytR family transcriptional regulator [Oceanobacillus piezotolerans]
MDSRKKRKKKKSKRVLFFVLLSITILFLSLASYATYLYFKAESVFSESYAETTRDKSSLRDVKVDPKFDNISILIIGVDESKNRKNAGNSRSDALMLATLNKDEKSVKLLSIPRDSYVHIPGLGYETRINHAYQSGGTEGTIETVETLLDVPIDYYVKLNFEGFVDVIDSIGTVRVNVPYEITEGSYYGTAKVHLEPGVQKLNGEEALAFARTRKQDNDIERGKRQQEVVKATVQEVTSLDSLFNYEKIIEAVGDNMTTDLRFDEMKSFITYGMEGSNLNFETLTLAGTDYQPGNMYFWKLDEEELENTKRELKEHLEL